MKKITIKYDLDTIETKAFYTTLETLGELYSTLSYVNANTPPMFISAPAKAIKIVYLFMEEYDDTFLTKVEGFDYPDGETIPKPTLLKKERDVAYEFMVQFLGYNETILHKDFIKSLTQAKDFLRDKFELDSKPSPEVLQAAKNILKRSKI